MDQKALDRQRDLAYELLESESVDSFRDETTKRYDRFNQFERSEPESRHTRKAWEEINDLFVCIEALIIAWSRMYCTLEEEQNIPEQVTKIRKEHMNTLISEWKSRKSRLMDSKTQMIKYRDMHLQRKRVQSKRTEKYDCDPNVFSFRFEALGRDATAEIFKRTNFEDGTWISLLLVNKFFYNVMMDYVVDPNIVMFDMTPLDWAMKLRKLDCLNGLEKNPKWNGRGYNNNTPLSLVSSSWWEGLLWCLERYQNGCNVTIEDKVLAALGKSSGLADLRMKYQSLKKVKGLEKIIIQCIRVYGKNQLGEEDQTITQFDQKNPFSGCYIQ
eukprot:TRINITY_DN6014_c0_g1_i1.p1 TRINITY_DN6014_c0_g1~~TRINITY_DN6014_c0_g1_i1.p1  ORF type:complete len:328 (+),score=51.97 TRINITY_DN6014_c0_g1_i1:825-1808(+)